jgi:hypothetical protein
MRALGVEVSSTTVTWILLDGTVAGGRIEYLDPAKLLLPQAAAAEIDNLLELKKFAQLSLSAANVERAGIIRADMGTSPIRAKVECMLQMCFSDLKIPSSLISIQTVNAAIKTGVQRAANASFDDCFGVVKPAYLQKAGYCAWCVLNGK